MRREIKFRIWDNKNKEWLGVSDNDALTYYGFHLVGEVMTVQSPPQWALDDGNVVEQYTGLTDKNGKDIYEGDIVSVYEFDKKSLREVYKYTTDICWNNRSAMFWTGHAESLCDEITEDHYEIIGNIHENKELLDKNDKV